MTTTETTTTMAREMVQNHERRTCPGCGTRIMKSRQAYRYANGEVRCTSCPAPVPAPVPEEPSAPADTRRRNRYPGTCECGRHLRAGEGYLEREGLEWQVFCGRCGLSNTVG